MNLENFFKTPQEGGPTEKETVKLRASLIKQGELSPNATLSDLVQYVRKQNKQTSWSDRVSRGQVPSTKKQNEEAGFRQYGQPYSKADGGYVKKYAKGGGVRKVRR